MRYSILWLAYFCISDSVVSVAVAGVMLPGTEAGLTERLTFKNFEDDATPSFIVLGVGGFRIPGQQNFTQVVNTAPAQEFVPSVGGPLSSVSPLVQIRRSTGEPLIVEVRDSIAGLPNDVLGSVSLNQDTFTTSSPGTKSTIDFSSQDIILTAGQPYFVVFHTEEPGKFNTVYWIRTFDPNPLSLGTSPIFSGTGGMPPWFDLSRPQEIGLEVRVVPEPTTLAMLAVFLVLHWSRRVLLAA